MKSDGGFAPEPCRASGVDLGVAQAPTQSSKVSRTGPEGVKLTMRDLHMKKNYPTLHYRYNRLACT